MTSQCDELKLLFIQNPSFAIKKSQNIILSFTNFNSYQEFYSYHLHNPHISTCQREWAHSQMAIHCVDCSIDKNSCFCLPCFLNGNHEGHEIVVSPFSTGNCDCGNLSNIKISGCCKEHQGLNENDHPEAYLDEKLRDLLTDIIFKSIFESFPHLQSQPEGILSLVFQFILSFLQFGDGFRRLIVISLTEKIKFENLLSQMFEYSYYFNQLFQQLCGRLLNDQLFLANFSKASYQLIFRQIIPEMYTSILMSTNHPNYSIWNNFLFHCFSPQTIRMAVEKFNWDWVDFSIQFSINMKTFFILPKTLNSSQIPLFLRSISNQMKSASKIQPNEQTQSFFDQLFTKVLNCGIDKNKSNETIISVSFFEMHDDLYYITYKIFNTIFYYILKCFKKKKNLQMDKLIEELDRNMDISQIFCTFRNSFGNENDLFVSKYVEKIENISDILINMDSMIKVPIEDHFKSFHNGGAFFYTFPLFDSLLYLFRNDDISRIKISRLLSEKKYKKTKIKLAIVALKKMIALLCCHQSLVSKKNYAFMNIILPLLNDSKNVHEGIPLIFPVFQLLLGLQTREDEEKDDFSIKEFFSFEIARELGIFDDFSGVDYKDENVVEKQKEMIVTFLFLVILINTERTLFDFNAYNFMEEQIIFALKQGVSSPADLNKVYNAFSLTRKHHSYYNSIVSKVAKIKSTNDGVSFSLKEEVKWKPISAIVPFNDLKVVLNKEISKKKNFLLKIQDFSDEDDYFFNQKDEKVKDSEGLKIKLKEFLSTPTVLAIVYHTLRTSGEKIELEDHFALNILVLISKFVEDFDSVNQYDSSTVIHYDSTIIDLIRQLKKVLFNFETDEKETAKITNTLNKQNFNVFLNMKIVSENSEAKSLIEILASKGEIGKSVIQQLSIEIENNQNDQQSLKETKKQRAKDIKKSIINQYKNIISNFYNDEDSTKENESENDEELCSICSSTKSDEILSFPLFIYKTKLPFIIDKPPFSMATSELAADEDKKAESRDFLGFLFPQQQQAASSQFSPSLKRVTEGNNYVIQFSICQHQVHQSCVNDRPFKCPIDRSQKNGFLPFLSELSPSTICSSEKVDIESIDERVIGAITGFVNEFTDFFESQEIELFTELSKSIGGLISTFEIRLRNLPDCLDSEKNKILSRNLFLTAWYGYRMMFNPEIESIQKLTEFQRFILKLIQNDEIEKSDAPGKERIVKKIVSSFVAGEFNDEEDEKRKEKKIFLFLKRVCLANYFLLDIEIDGFNKNGSKFIDWDEILSVSNLSTKFNVSLSNLDDFEFKPIVFAKLPKEFLRFAGKPFNFPVEKSTEMTIYNILDYNGLIQKFDDFSDTQNSEENDQCLNYLIQTAQLGNPMIFSQFVPKDYPSVLLMIGYDASNVVLIYKKDLVLLKPFYLDNFGCPDVGFGRGKQLFLSEEKYARVMDLVLSGDFSFYIKDKKDIIREMNLNM